MKKKSIRKGKSHKTTIKRTKYDYCDTCGEPFDAVDIAGGGAQNAVQ